MKLLKNILLVLLIVSSVGIYGQDNTALPERTPEQEAVKQTEKMQQELKLTTEQARQIHEINLKYARARKVSNTRSDAIQRIKDKEAEFTRVLNDVQRSTLQNKRYERSSFQSNENVRTETQQPASRTYPSENTRSTYRTTPANTGAIRSGNEGSTDIQRPTYRSVPDARSTVRTAVPAGSSTRSSSPSSGSSSSSRSSSPSQQPSSSGRR